MDARNLNEEKKIMFYLQKTLWLVLITIVLLSTQSIAGQKDIDQNKKQKVQILNIDQCINLALKNNHLAKISAQSIKIAQAQYQQVMASYWPQVSASATYIRLDEAPIFVYPEETSDYQISGLLDLPPMEVSVTVPEKRTKLMDRTHGVFSLDFLYPLYLGGLRPALKDQARGQINLRQQEKRQSDLQIIYDVKERYYGNVLAKKLCELGQETVDRVEVTLELTENMYKNGSGSVSKTDYLKNKMFAASIRSLQASLKNNLALSASALNFTISDPSEAPIQTSDSNLPFEKMDTHSQTSDTSLFLSNPNWQKTLHAIEIFEAKVDEAESEYMFNVALIGKLNHIENDYEAGAVSAPDKNSWMVGFGVQMPLFTGFSTKNKVQEMNARLSELKAKQFMLKDGLALQIKMELQKIESLQEKINSSREAMDAAVENRDLTERAYSIEMASAQDMIQSQLFESLMIAQYHKAIYDHILAKAKLDLLIGTEVKNKIEG